MQARVLKLLVVYLSLSWLLSDGLGEEAKKFDHVAETRGTQTGYASTDLNVSIICKDRSNFIICKDRSNF